MGAVKAAIVARMALCGDGAHVLSLGKVAQGGEDHVGTGADMKVKCKETARGQRHRMLKRQKGAGNGA
jgi:L-serine dehydratase